MFAQISRGAFIKSKEKEQCFGGVLPVEDTGGEAQAIGRAGSGGGCGEDACVFD